MRSNDGATYGGIVVTSAHAEAPTAAPRTCRAAYNTLIERLLGVARRRRLRGLCHDLHQRENRAAASRALHLRSASAQPERTPGSSLPHQGQDMSGRSSLSAPAVLGPLTFRAGDVHRERSDWPRPYCNQRCQDALRSCSPAKWRQRLRNAGGPAMPSVQSDARSRGVARQTGTTARLGATNSDDLSQWSPADTRNIQSLRLPNLCGYSAS